MSALAPSVSHTLALERGADIAWMEVCSVAGTKAFKADADAAGSAVSHERLGQAGHCPFCSTHAASFALLPATAPGLRDNGSARIRPLLFYQSPRPLAIWTDAQSRAPPRFS